MYLGFSQTSCLTFRCLENPQRRRPEKKKVPSQRDAMNSQSYQKGREAAKRKSNRVCDLLQIKSVYNTSF